MIKPFKYRRARQVSMSSRERVITTLEHRQPDRPPVDLGGTVSGIHKVAYASLIKTLGIDLPVRVDPRDVQQLAKLDEPILRRLGVDFRHVCLKSVPGPGGIELNSSGRPCFVDEWGITWGRNLHYYDMVDHPLKDATIEDLEWYPWPDPGDPRRFEGLQEEVEALHHYTDYAIQADAFFGGIYEAAWWLRGFEAFTIDMYRRPEFASLLLDKLQVLYFNFYTRYLDIVGPYAQIFDYNDDIGMQTGPLLSPTIFRKFLKPRYAEIFKLIHSKTRAKIFMHTCGSVRKLIPDLIEIGLDVLNPIQPLASGMEINGLKRDFGERLSFHGGVDIQRILPNGSSIEVEAEVKRVIEVGGRGGGLILAGAHNIQADVPPRNVLSMFNAVGSIGGK
jgi:uroporphyrinogen decarboxylase